MTRTPADSARSMVSASGSHSPSSVRSDEPCSPGSGGSGQVRQYGSPTARRGAAGGRGSLARGGPLCRGGEPAVDERGADAERGVVTVELERRGVGLDELDLILELRLPDE